MFTFGDGQSATSPPDVRLTSFVKGAGTSGASYTSPSTETYTYLSGSGQTQQINRTGSNIMLGYDALGRRSFDYNSTDTTKSRRDYTYLPNGQHGTVSGRDKNNVAYSITVRYDAEGRPLTIATNTDSYELFWDDANRLIAVSINSGAIQWHYHYLGSTLLAATRDIHGAVKRFWAESDERGLVYRLLDDQGATYWQARWDATGWRQIVGTPQANMWFPFALPGQVILEGTAAFTGASTTTVRPEIALNQWRAYDPQFGAFTQPDQQDHSGRSGPEGYVYGRNNATLNTDGSGKSSLVSGVGIALSLTRSLVFDQTCDGVDRIALTLSTAMAIQQINSCTSGECDLGGGESVRRAWISSLEHEHYSCPKSGWFQGGFIMPNTPNGIFRGWNFASGTFGTAWYNTLWGYPNALISPAGFDPHMSTEVSAGHCLAQTVAHEGLHHANAHMLTAQVVLNASIESLEFGESIHDWLEDMADHGEDYNEENTVRHTVTECVNCR